MFKERKSGIFLIAFGYIAAALIGVAVYHLVGVSPWLSLLIADLVATVFIWLFSLILRNASAYDPYWSVQPVVIIALTLFSKDNYSFSGLLIFLVIAIWGVRLTLNWLRTFQGLHMQDWRYEQLSRQTGRYYPLVNLAGIQLVPTLIVYACTLPAFYYVKSGGGLNLVTFIGLAISLGGTLLEAAADTQMHHFQQSNPDHTKLISSGLWRYSRHPNYLGEILMWWGILLVLFSVRPDFWYFGLGALLNTCLFLFISIPLAETHLASYKPGFSEYQAQTWMLLPFPRHGNKAKPIGRLQQ